MVWDGVVAGYLYLAGIGAGSFVFGALAVRANPEARRTKLICLVIGLAAVGIGTLLLVADARAGLMNPARFFLLLSNFESVMSWGVLLIMLFMAVAAVELIFYWRSADVRRFDYLGCAVAFGVAVYTGALLGAVGAYPLWHPVVLPMLFVVSAASTGFAAGILGSRFFDSEQFKSLVFYKKALLALPLIEAVLLALLLILTANAPAPASAAGVATVSGLIVGRHAPMFWIGLVILGIAFPIAADRLVAKSGEGRGLLLAGEAGVLAGGFFLRYLIIVAAVPMVALM